MPGFPTQDTLLLGPFPIPGKVTILSASRKSKWQINSGWGVDGGNTIWVGVEPAEIKLRIEMWDPLQYEAWKIVAKAIFVPTAKTGQLALDIKHPILNDPPLNITAVQVVEVQAMQQDDQGGWSTEITLVEFKRPKPAIGQPKAAIPTATNPPPTAQDAQDVKIAALSAQLAGLAAK